MELIEEDSWSMSVYLGAVIELEGGDIIDGNKVWDEYKRLLLDKDMKYAENRIKLSKVRSKMNYFIYQIKKNSDFSYNDRSGELYYIEDGSQYFDNGKLNKEKFINGVGEFI